MTTSKPPACMMCGEFFVPVERFVACDFWIVYEGVSALDVVVQVGEFSVFAGCVEPEGEFCDLYAFVVDVHAVKVVFKYCLVGVEQAQGRGG
jgi:hypothetical protein